MHRCVAAGCKVIGACPSADGSGVSVQKIVEAAEFCCTKIDEGPDRYKIVRTAQDIDDALSDEKPGIDFTHPGHASPRR